MDADIEDKRTVSFNSLEGTSLRMSLTVSSQEIQTLVVNTRINRQPTVKQSDGDRKPPGETHSQVLPGGHHGHIGDGKLG